MTSFGISFVKGAPPVSKSGTSLQLQSTPWLSALPWEEPTESPRNGRTHTLVLFQPRSQWESQLECVLL